LERSLVTIYHPSLSLKYLYILYAYRELNFSERDNFMRASLAIRNLACINRVHLYAKQESHTIKREGNKFSQTASASCCIIDVEIMETLVTLECVCVLCRERKRIRCARVRGRGRTNKSIYHLFLSAARLQQQAQQLLLIETLHPTMWNLAWAIKLKISPVVSIAQRKKACIWVHARKLC
jgi:hypothetical protein